MRPANYGKDFLHREGRDCRYAGMRLLAFSLLSSLVCSIVSFAGPAEDLDHFQNIVIDLRGSRGGRGDVAAGYLTALDMMKRLGYSKPITLLVEGPDETGKAGDGARILGLMMGRGPVKQGDQLFNGQLRVLEAGKVPENFPRADLYLNLANPSGLFHFEKGFEKPDAPRAGGVPIDEKTVLIAETVLGNTENIHARHALGSLRKGELTRDIPTPGMAVGELGVYDDAVASSLKGRSKDELKQYILTEIGHAKNPDLVKNLRAILGAGTPALEGSKPVLAYGITAKEVKGQFEGYLAALVERAEKEHTSFTILTPSGFKLEDIKSDALREKVKVFIASEPGRLPARAVPGEVQVVKTGNLSHRLFTGLMALSEAPPVVAGDNAMSAAISLGRPFVMTRVAWNAKNIENLSKRLREAPNLSEADKNSLLTIFPQPKERLGLTSVLDLESPSIQEAFKTLSKRTGLFTDQILSLAHEAATTETPPAEIAEALAKQAAEASKEVEEGALLHGGPYYQFPTWSAHGPWTSEGKGALLPAPKAAADSASILQGSAKGATVGGTWTQHGPWLQHSNSWGPGVEFGSLSSVNGMPPAEATPVALHGGCQDYFARLGSASDSK